MWRFQIQAKGLLIGFSNLEYGDPPMGIAHGQFIPNEDYDAIQQLVICTHGDQDHLGLSVRTAEGEPVSCEWIGITDQSRDFGADGLYIELIAASDSVYQEFFPHHLAEYERRFA